jgi:hypothetical protein
MFRFNIYWYYIHLKKIKYLYNLILIIKPTICTNKVYILSSPDYLTPLSEGVKKQAGQGGGGGGNTTPTTLIFHQNKKKKVCVNWVKNNGAWGGVGPPPPPP